jgi:hypothetical protein
VSLSGRLEHADTPVRLAKLSPAGHRARKAGVHMLDDAYHQVVADKFQDLEQLPSTATPSPSQPLGG